MAGAVAWDKSQYRRRVNDREARRVMLYGVTGAGKTTAAARISEATGIPWVSVDDLTWEPGWVAVPPEEQRRLVTEICAGDTWLLDTAYGDWLDVPMARVELVVALDYPRWLSLQRLVRRTLARVLDKKTICNGNTETLRQMLGSDSIIRWHFRSFARKRERIAAWAADPAGPRVLRFTTPRELDRWIAGLGPVTRRAEEQAG
jgi:adenylate kinase family enzyme